MRRKRRTKEKWDKKKQKEKRTQIWEGCPSSNHLEPSCCGHAQILCLMYTNFPSNDINSQFFAITNVCCVSSSPFPFPCLTGWAMAHHIMTWGTRWWLGWRQGAGLTGEEGAALEVIGTHVGEGAAAGEQPDHRGPGGAARAAARGDWPRGEHVCTQTGIPARDSSVLRVWGTRRLAVREARSYCGNGEE